MAPTTLAQLPARTLLSYTDIAQLLAVQPATLRHYRHQGIFPDPDAYPIPGHPRWRAATIRKWQAGRPGIGAPGVPSPGRARSAAASHAARRRKPNAA